MENEFARRATLLAPIDNDGRVLLQLRDNDTTRCPGCWGFFGGEIEKVESPKEAGIREAKEELGLEVTDIKFFRRYELAGSDGEIHEYFVYTFSCNIGVEQLKQQQNEGESLGLFGKDDILTLQFGAHELDVLRDIFDMLDSA